MGTAGGRPRQRPMSIPHISVDQLRRQNRAFSPMDQRGLRTRTAVGLRSVVVGPEPTNATIGAAFCAVQRMSRGGARAAVGHTACPLAGGLPWRACRPSDGRVPLRDEPRTRGGVVRLASNDSQFDCPAVARVAAPVCAPADHRMLRRTPCFARRRHAGRCCSTPSGGLAVSTGRRCDGQTSAPSRAGLTVH
jgi:hypothetical protein